MLRRTAILIDERDHRLGTTPVVDSVLLVRHAGCLFVRTEKGIRLSGGGIAVVYQEVDPVERPRLNPL